MKTCLVFLVLLAIVFGQDSNSTTIDCTTIKECAQCGLSGCNYCMGVSDQAISGCLPSNWTQTDAHCNGQANDQRDQWFPPSAASKCAGCEGADTCDECSGKFGCGWCHDQDSGVCTFGKGRCKVWTSNTCEVPCENRDSCTGCSATGIYHCIWSTEKCLDLATNANATGITDYTKCPDYTPPYNSATRLVSMIGLFSLIVMF
eukprot:TRINITY_DN133_c0_g1_i1.p1 TRINITY_DN133_c0_g1~~TRINITY_DN133_c0_g1_i1.p1  ORF type:complete len:203 (+),score=21.21 TRINITY_DN133_c0_g1_i1:60-668(+)